MNRCDVVMEQGSLEKTCGGERSVTLSMLNRSWMNKACCVDFVDVQDVTVNAVDHC